jgi:hypothetical protein
MWIWICPFLDLEQLKIRLSHPTGAWLSLAKMTL